MSISSEISRISGNISDALDSIASKGITVPAGANSDDLSALIDEIPVYDHVTITQGLSKSGMAAFFDAGTSADHDVFIAPKYSNPEGIVSAHTDTEGTPEYYKIKTDNPEFSGAGVTGNVTVSATNGTISTATNNSGVVINAQVLIERASVLYNGAVSGWVEKADASQAMPAQSNTFSSSACYLNGVTISIPQTGTNSFSITVPNGSSGTVTFTFVVDTSGNVTIS